MRWWSYAEKHCGSRDEPDHHAERDREQSPEAAARVIGCVTEYGSEQKDGSCDGRKRDDPTRRRLPARVGVRWKCRKGGDQNASEPFDSNAVIYTR